MIAVSFGLKKFIAKRFGFERRPAVFQPDPDVHRLLSVERAERLRADAVDWPRRRGALRSRVPALAPLRARRHSPAQETS
jgi:hypothetical protein